MFLTSRFYRVLLIDHFIRDTVFKDMKKKSTLNWFTGPLCTPLLSAFHIFRYERNTFMINSFVMIIKLGKMNLTVQQVTNILLSRFNTSSSKFCRKCKCMNVEKYCRYSRIITDIKCGKYHRCSRLSFMLDSHYAGEPIALK